MYELEYAQFFNGEFRAWISGGLFHTLEEAERAAEGRCLAPSDYMIGRVDDDCEEA